MSRQLVGKKISAVPKSEKKIIQSPPPLKLNGCSLYNKVNVLHPHAILRPGQRVSQEYILDPIHVNWVFAIIILKPDCYFFDGFF